MEGGKQRQKVAWQEGGGKSGQDVHGRMGASRPKRQPARIGRWLGSQLKMGEFELRGRRVQCHGGGGCGGLCCLVTVTRTSADRGPSRSRRVAFCTGGCDACVTRTPLLSERGKPGRLPHPSLLTHRQRRPQPRSGWRGRPR